MSDTSTLRQRIQELVEQGITSDELSAGGPAVTKLNRLIDEACERVAVAIYTAALLSRVTPELEAMFAEPDEDEELEEWLEDGDE